MYMFMYVCMYVGLFLKPISNVFKEISIIEVFILKKLIASGVIRVTPVLR